MSVELTWASTRRTRRGRCLPKLRMFLFTGVMGAAAGCMYLVWMTQGSRVNGLVVLAALTATLYAAVSLPHLAIAIFCPSRNCWPWMLEMARKENGEDGDDDAAVVTAAAAVVADDDAAGDEYGDDIVYQEDPENGEGKK